MRTRTIQKEVTMTGRSMFATVAFLFMAALVQAQEVLVFEAEDFTEPTTAWLKDKSAPDKWNLWSTDKDADKKWSKGVVLQSPVVQKDREKPEDGAPVLHTVITNIPPGTWRVTVKHGRCLAVSLDGKEWKDLSATGGLLGKFEIKDGKFELWVDDRFAHKPSPGSSYYDCLIFTPVMAEKMGVANGDFEFGKELTGSGWAWWSRDGKGSAEFSAEAHGGKRCAKLQHDGERDWAFSNSGRLDVQPGQAWSASAWVKCQNTGGIELAIVALSKGQTMNWAIGSDGVYGTKDWTRIVAAAQIPPACDQIYVRLTGSGKTLAWVDDVAIQQGQETRKREPRPAVAGWAKTRVEEKLGRGMVVMPVAGGKVYLGWRLLKDDPKEVAFNVYRSTGKQPGVKLNDKPLTATTDFLDASPSLNRDNAYWVRPVVGGRELDPSEQGLVPPKPDVKPYLSFKLKGDHTFQKVG
ncbi:MAG: hypothetical protein FJ279_31185, partial [Planctomycetes bacterium]|nr:hypothetical protein [Planctomycetota bacterium]